jgi:hypothetical protein
VLPVCGFLPYRNSQFLTKKSQLQKNPNIKKGTSDLFFELFFDDKSAIIPVKTIAKMAH